MLLRPSIARLLRALVVLALLVARAAHADREPATIVVLGATGDLTGRLLTPALTEIVDQLPKGSRVVGIGRPGKFTTDGDFRTWLADRSETMTGKPLGAGWATLQDRLHFQAMNLTDGADYHALKQRLAKLDHDDMASGELKAPRRVIFYYAIAPNLIGPTTDELAKAGLIGPGTKNDIVPEKPIGTDGKTATEVIDKVIAAAGKDHVYFMDHYNGKAGVASMQRLRADPRFAKIWDKRYIEHIEVKALESIGAEGRGAFYDPTGATRDMVQSHLLQSLAFATMRPKSSSPDDVEAAKILALESLGTNDGDVVRGQYGAGGKLGSYKSEQGVSPGSTTETYVKLRLRSSVRKLKDVPITIESGKALTTKQSQIVVHWKRLPTDLALAVGLEPGDPAKLEVDLASGEVKLAGKPIALAEAPSKQSAYATQLLRIVDQDKAFFPSPKEIGAAWRLIDPIERKWKAAGDKGLQRYKAGSNGPNLAKRLSFKGR